LTLAPKDSEFPDLFKNWVETGLSGQHFDPAALGIQPVLTPRGEFSPPHWIDRFEISESDPRLNPGGKVQIGISNVSPKGAKGLFGNDTTEMNCTILDWVAVGADADALPFKAAKLRCDAVIVSSQAGYPDDAKLKPNTYRSSEISWYVPELGLALDMDRKRYDWTLKQERPGEWRLVIPSNQASARGVFDLLIISPEAAARYPALRN
jgi:hypothetical protein